MTKTLKVVLTILIVLAIPTMAFAGSPWVDKTTYGDKTIGKFTYGLENTALGWTELIRKPIDSVKNHTNVFVGFGHGIMNTVTYTLGGVIHLVTFPFTSIDVPIPNDGVKF